MMLTYSEFFAALTENKPFPYQNRLGIGDWPALLDVPTGTGKTAAAIVAWLWKRLRRDEGTGRRLFYCLPMRTLVEQTYSSAVSWCEKAASEFRKTGLDVPTVHKLLGGDVDQSWDLSPEQDAIIIGTQDMLLSRALNRGYAMSRYRWPVHYALSNNDCFWVFDETQLMGVAVETSAQLDGLRRELGTVGPTSSMWMSATLGQNQLDTVDHRCPPSGWVKAQLDSEDLDHPVVRERLDSRKTLERAPAPRLSKASAKDYIKGVAAAAAEAHNTRGGLTLVVVNRVIRAQQIYTALREALDAATPVALVHSRFRPIDRAAHEKVLFARGDRVVVATQAVEAGVDVSATTLVTELAPWSSLVQRFGRCNRYGEQDQGLVLWLDLDENDGDGRNALPYEPDALLTARKLLSAVGDDVGPTSLGNIHYAAPTKIRPVVRRRDVFELFDTSAELGGDDIDISRFIRDGEDTDVQVYWRPFEGDDPGMQSPPVRDELCRVGVGAFSEALKQLTKLRKQAREPRLQAWCWNRLGGQWQRLHRVRPGQVVLLWDGAGGYSPGVGWLPKLAPELVPFIELTEDVAPETLDGDARTAIGCWVQLTTHLGHVETEAAALGVTLELALPFADAVAVAGRWHDVGKAHPEFQRRLLTPVEDGRAIGPGREGVWAKSGHMMRVATERSHFRHELASALAWLVAGTATTPMLHSLIGFLIAAHHGKVRVSLRSLPDEGGDPENPERMFSRGVWDGDMLPRVTLPDGTNLPEITLALGAMRMGEGSWLERVLRLRDSSDLGPFRLALLETVVRVADWRASGKEQRGEYDA